MSHLFALSLNIKVHSWNGKQFYSTLSGATSPSQSGPDTMAMKEYSNK